MSGPGPPAAVTRLGGWIRARLERALRAVVCRPARRSVDSQRPPPTVCPTVWIRRYGRLLNRVEPASAPTLSGASGARRWAGGHGPRRTDWRRRGYD